MARGQKPKVEKQQKKTGRPSAYREEFAEQAKKLCRLGARDSELAEFFGVSEVTINAWKKEFPNFLNALKEGKGFADAEVASKLYHRATGYSHPDVHISNYQGKITVTKITKHYPPDTTACIFWLKNRRPDLWRDHPVEGEEDDEKLPKMTFAYNVVDGRVNADAD